MAANGVTVTLKKSDNNFDIDNVSYENSKDTITLSSDSEDDNQNRTINLDDDKCESLEANDVDPAGNVTSRSETEVFSFVGAEYSRDEDSILVAESPIKRPHSPENINTNIKRKCEEHEDESSTETILPEMNESTEMPVPDALRGKMNGEELSPIDQHNPTGTLVPPLPEGVWPSTVTRLISPTGGQVYLVGTAHFSQESQEDVAKVIQQVQPHIVTVELCKSRINIMQLDENTILQEAQNIDLAKIRDTVKQNGVFNGLMYILLLYMSAHLTKELGMAPGGEFRRALREARQVPNCTVHLGDRPIHITLQRALASLSWWQTTKLTWHILTTKDPISKEEVEKCKQKDLLEEMLAEMTGEFPALSEVFVHERDMFLAHSLALAAQPIPTPFGLIPAKVVGVVGIGHVQGIVEQWGKVGEEDIAPIMRIPPPSMTSKVMKFTLRVSVVGLVVWGAYKILPVPRLPPFSQSIARFWE